MSSEPIVPYRVYTPAEAAELLRLPVDVALAAIKSGELAARTAGGESRILGQALINYVLPWQSNEPPRPDDKAPTPGRRRSQAPRPTERGHNIYDVTTVRGGKDDSAIERLLSKEWESIRHGEEVTVEPDSMKRPHWNGAVNVQIRDDAIEFPEGKDHANIPVAIKAATRVLHRNGLRGRLRIQAWDTHLTIGPPSR